MTTPSTTRVTLDDLRRCKADRRKFAMLTAYDYPTARAAAAAGLPTLLVGDSVGTVVLGHPNTRSVPLDLMITLAEAVRRGAPHVFLMGDVPYVAMAGGTEAVVAAARRFRDEAGCDAVKFEAGPEHGELVAALRAAQIITCAHLGLLPQSVSSPDGYRAQARDADAIAALVAQARRMVAAGASLLLLEAVPPEASAAVLAAVEVPVIGCGAGPACDGHVVVTHDLLGYTPGHVPRFVPVLEHLHERLVAAMRQWAEDIATGRYPAPEHTYSMRR
jgi:3-methyl-2-oxobutanoate hydroxymethyltransferase